jgi:hypothetical protein
VELDDDGSIPDTFRAKKRARLSHILLPGNGVECVVDGVTRWKWRDLARMGLDYLTIPAMSAEPERVFSAAKIALSDRRCRMEGDAVEALECLKSWQRVGLIATSREGIKVIEDMLKALCEEDLG